MAQGGDWGAIVVDAMGAQAAPELLGIHTNMAGAVPSDVSQAIQSGPPPPSGMSDEEGRAFERLKTLFATGVGYALEMGTRPQTLYGIADSPVGLAAWLLDLGDGDAKPAAAITEALRRPSTGTSADVLTRDDVLDNITLFWLTNTGVSSGRLYWENKLPFFDPKGVSIPVAVSVFPGEFYQPSRSWTERAYPNLTRRPEAAISRPGNSPSSSRPSCARASDLFASSRISHCDHRLPSLTSCTRASIAISLIFRRHAGGTTLAAPAESQSPTREGGTP